MSECGTISTEKPVLRTTAAEQRPRAAASAIVSGNEQPEIDEVLISPEELWESRVARTLYLLQQALGTTDITIAEESGRPDFDALAASFEVGSHVTISRGFLEGMAAGEEAFSKGAAILRRVFDLAKQAAPGEKNGIYVDDDGNLYAWEEEEKPESDFWKRLQEQFADSSKGLFETMEELKAKAANEKAKWTVVTRLGYYAGKDLARLARLTRIADTKVFVSGIHASMNRVRYNRYADKDEIKSTVSMMENVIRRAKAKIHSLTEEQTLEVIRKHAAEKKELEQSRMLEMLLKKRRTARKCREYGQIVTEGGMLPGFMKNNNSTEDDPLQSNSVDAAYLAGTMPVPVAAPVGVASVVPAVAATPSAGTAVTVNIVV